ncbi:MAG: type IV secretion system DNA-binding domain-containing protein [Phycisphaerales bacterium]|nr:type IV secretion system DNA-binding domain-containing protein [Phycisphaerales bacterium]
MSSTIPTKERVLQVRRAFLTPVIVCAAGIVLIHILPKPYTPHSKMRMLMTLGYFVAWTVLLFKMMYPRSLYMRTLFEWKYAHCPAGMRKAWQSYLYSVDALARIVVPILLVFVLSVAIMVMRLWWQGLHPLAGIAKPAMWISGIAILVMPAVMGARFAEVTQRRRMFQEIAGTSDFKAEAIDPGMPTVEPDEPVTVRGEREFTAGGYEWTFDDFYKNSVVFGQSGTGKTVCVLNALLDGMLSSTSDSREKVGGLILDPKGDFLDKIQGLCERTGRRRDLLIIDPAQPGRSIRWNPLDSKDDELEIASRFAAVMECLGQKSDKDSYFLDAARKFMRHAIRLVRATNAGRPPDLEDIARLASSTKALAQRTDKLDPRRMSRDDEGTLDFFADEWLELADQTKTSVQSTLTNMIDPFLMDPYRTLFSGKSSVTLGEMIDQGRLLYVHMPIADKESMSRMVCTFLKLEYFREVLKRVRKPRPTFFFCDEFQCYYTTTKGKGDADFFERSRQSNHANIIATQNIPSLLKYAERKELVDNLLGNCAIKVFLRNTDEQTNKYAAEQFGQEMMSTGGVSVGDLGVGRQKGAPGAQINYQYDFKIRPEAFAALTVPAIGSSDHCEAIVHLASRGQIEHQRLRWKVHPL